MNNTYDIIMKFAVFILFSFCTYTDMRTRKISVLANIITSIIFLLMGISLLNYSLDYMLGGVSIGIVVILLSIITRGAVGVGDGIMLITSGIYLGFNKNISIFIYGLILSAICAIILLISKRYDKKYTIPFAPFLLCSYILVMCL